VCERRGKALVVPMLWRVVHVGGQGVEEAPDRRSTSPGGPLSMAPPQRACTDLKYLRVTSAAASASLFASATASSCCIALNLTAARLRPARGLCLKRHDVNGGIRHPLGHWKAKCLLRAIGGRCSAPAACAAACARIADSSLCP
jgi:hypothetical protein